MHSCAVLPKSNLALNKLPWCNAFSTILAKQSLRLQCGAFLAFSFGVYKVKLHVVWIVVGDTDLLFDAIGSGIFVTVDERK